MITFIIVDDQDDYQKQLKSIILKIVFKISNIEIKCFSEYNGELQKEIEDTGKRKVYILDVNLGKKISGIDIALKIRQCDWDSEIIFLTFHQQYFEKVYRSIYKVFDFVEKHNHMIEHLTKDINSIINQKYDVKMFKYSNRQIDLQVHLKDILYIYRDTIERKVAIVTTHSKFLISKSITDILKNLDERFIQTHRSCIVNKDHVSLFKWNEGSFVLDNRMEIFLLSKNYKKTVTELVR